MERYGDTELLDFLVSQDRNYEKGVRDVEDEL